MRGMMVGTLILTTLFCIGCASRRVEYSDLELKQAKKQYSLGLELVKQGRYEEALEVAKRLIKKYPDTSFEKLGYHLMCEVFKAQGDLEKAIEAMWKEFEVNAKDESPEFVRGDKAYILVKLAELYAERGEEDKAREMLWKAWKDYPGTSYAREAGLMLASTEEKEEARKMYLKAKEYYLKKEYKRALETLNEAFERYPLVLRDDFHANHLEEMIKEALKESDRR